MERRELEDILAGIRSARSERETVALATVVRVRGSAYRREGARMLIQADGSQICMLSGGCLEPEVALGARFVIEDLKPSLTGYDLAEDVVWGLGIGCGGSVEIYVEPVAAENADPLLEAWLSRLETGRLAVRATIMPDEATGVPTAALGTVIVDADGGVQGSLEGPLMGAVRLEALRMMASLYPRAEPKRLLNANVFLDVSSPPPELVLFGAGHDTMPLAARGTALGWAVTVVDARERFLTPERFPGAQLVQSEQRAQIGFTPRSFCIVMNHHLERDTETLRFLLEQPHVPYIGVLGPRSRYEEMLTKLRATGFAPTPAQLGIVRNPIGLDIGAESPDEVALSAMAELIAVRRGFQGGLLNGCEGRIHDPREDRAISV